MLSKEKILSFINFISLFYSVYLIYYYCTIYPNLVQINDSIIMLKTLYISYTTHLYLSISILSCILSFLILYPKDYLHLSLILSFITFSLEAQCIWIYNHINYKAIERLWSNSDEYEVMTVYFNCMNLSCYTSIINFIEQYLNCKELYYLMIIHIINLFILYPLLYSSKLKYLTKEEEENLLI